jgi:hypothetical protein
MVLVVLQVSFVVLVRIFAHNLMSNVVEPPQSVPLTRFAVQEMFVLSSVVSVAAPVVALLMMPAVMMEQVAVIRVIPAAKMVDVRLLGVYAAVKGLVERERPVLMAIVILQALYE